MNEVHQLAVEIEQLHLAVCKEKYVETPINDASLHIKVSMLLQNKPGH